MLLEIGFIDSYYGATKDGKRDWPPTPARLYSALVNSYYMMKKRESVNREALLWLEQQRAPDIIYPRLLNREDDSPLVYVPVNEYENNKSSFVCPNRQARRFPAAHAASHYIYYDWPGLEPHSDLEKIVKGLDQLGTSRSMIEVAHFIPTLPAHTKLFTRLAPTEGFSRRRYACYHPGRLAMLDAAYESGTAIPDGQYVGYRAVNSATYQQSTVAFLHYHVFALKGPYRLYSNHASLLAGAIREQLLHTAGTLNLAPEALVANQDAPHMAYLSLPFVGDYGEGRIMGVMIAIPAVAVPELLQCREVLNKFVRHFNYRNVQWSLVPVEEDGNTPKTLRVSTWDSFSTTWASVTPAEINWSKQKDKSPEKHLLEWCQKVGLPAVKNIVTQSRPFFGGSDDARNYHRRNLLKGRIGGFLTHLKIEFEQEVKGPLAIGNSANFSLGLMRPQRHNDNLNGI